MSNWSEQQFTRKGAELRAKVEAGKCKLALTKMKIGNGSVTVGEIEHMTDLKSPQLVFGISSCTVSEEDSTVCKTVGIASSSNVENSFLVSEMGIYATDPDIGEILYLVCIDSVPDTMPNKRVASPVTLTYQFDIVTSNTANITAMITPTGLATAKMVNEHRTAAELDHPEKSVHKKHLHQDAYESPALTGTPTVPTAGKGTNNGQIASTAFVAQAIAALVNSAPGALDTLQELAQALGNDTNFAATVTNALAGKLGKNETAARAYEWVGWSLERNRYYKNGDIAYHKSLPTWARLTCAKEGITATTLPNKISEPIYEPGDLFTDGAVIWIIDDVRDGTPFGTVIGDYVVRRGYIKANGATVLRADYPRLVTYADFYKLWTDDPASFPGLFGRGNGTTTMVVPNWTDRMLQFTSDNAGQGISAGLPNITGTFSHLSANGYANMAEKAYSGAFSVGPTKRGCMADQAEGNNEKGTHFNASKSNPIYGRSHTVQPAAIKLIPIIRY